MLVCVFVWSGIRLLAQKDFALNLCDAKIKPLPSPVQH